MRRNRLIRSVITGRNGPSRSVIVVVSYANGHKGLTISRKGSVRQRINKSGKAPNVK